MQLLSQLRRLSVLLALLPLAIVNPVSAGGDPGVSADRVLVGQVCALRGQASSLGRGMRDGMRAYFARINRAGGIHGRQIELVSVDDGYEPEQSLEATRELIRTEGVFALIGAVGTPTTLVTVPLAKEEGVPFIAPFTGAGFLRDPGVNEHVMNLRASYDQEMERLAEHLVDELGLERIACFYQNDGYGKVGLAGIRQALAERGLELVSTGRYERNTVAIASGLRRVARGQPQAVVMVGAYTGCAAFIRSARASEQLRDAVLCNISFVGTEALQRALGPDGDGVIVSQVVPFPWDVSLPVVAEFHRDMNAEGYAEEIGFISLEGYLAARMFCTALALSGEEPTRSELLASFESMERVSLGGLEISLGPGDNQGLDTVYLTRLTARGVEPIDRGFAGVMGEPIDAGP